MSYPIHSILILSALMIEIFPKVSKCLNHFDSLNSKDTDSFAFKNIRKYFLTTVFLNLVLPKMLNKKKFETNDVKADNV